MIIIIELLVFVSNGLILIKLKIFKVIFFVEYFMGEDCKCEVEFYD